MAETNSTDLVTGIEDLAGFKTEREIGRAHV